MSLGDKQGLIRWTMGIVGLVYIGECGQLGLKPPIAHQKKDPFLTGLFFACEKSNPSEGDQRIAF